MGKSSFTSCLENTIRPENRTRYYSRIKFAYSKGRLLRQPTFLGLKVVADNNDGQDLAQLFSDAEVAEGKTIEAKQKELVY